MNGERVIRIATLNQTTSTIAKTQAYIQYYLIGSRGPSGNIEITILFSQGPNSGSTYVSDEKWPSRADDDAETPTSVPADFSFDETDDDVDAIKLAREETPPSLPERIYDEPPAESDHLESIPMKNANKSVDDYSQKLSTFV